MVEDVFAANGALAVVSCALSLLREVRVLGVQRVCRECLQRLLVLRRRIGVSWLSYLSMLHVGMRQGWPRNANRGFHATSGLHTVLGKGGMRGMEVMHVLLESEVLCLLL